MTTSRTSPNNAGPDARAPCARPAFIQKGYYVPLVLSNGVDFCQVDFTGSCAAKDHAKGYPSGWFKKGRPNGADPVALVKPYYTFKSDRGRVEAGDFAQHFDPRAGRLHTRVSLYQLDLRIETFLTDDHTLVEKYRVERSESRQGQLLFFLLFYNISYTGKPMFALPQREANLTCSIEDDAPTFTYRYGDDGDAFEGQGRMGVRLLRGTVRVQPCHESQYLLRITVDQLSEGDEFARIVTLVDDRDAPDWKAECGRIHAGYMGRSFEEGDRKALSSWQGFSGQSSFGCSEADDARLFDTSLYVCKASLHPNGSSVSALAHPNRHGMGTYWDIWYVHSALLRANRVAEARKIIDFWGRVHPEGKRFARERFESRGARFEWVYQYDGSCGRSMQVHSNTLPALMLWEHYLYTGNKELLARYADIIPDSTLFLIDFALKQDESGRWYLRELISCDESDTWKRNELMTAICLKKGIDLTRLAAGVLGREVPAEIAAAEAPIDGILASLKRDGGYLPYENGDTATWANLLAAIHYPDPAHFAKAADYALEGCREAHGLGIGRTSRMRCATFPWIEGMAAWSMILNGDRRAPEYLRMMTRYTNFYGGLPEYAWLHGEPSRDWFVAAHGMYVTALADLLVQMRDGRLAILPLGRESLPWTRVCFERFRVAGGILVSAEIADGQPIRVTLENDTVEVREFGLAGPGLADRIRLESGGSTRCEGSADV